MSANAIVAHELPSPEVEERVFRRMRLRLVRTLLRQAWQESRFRVSLIAGLSLMLWLGLYYLFSEGLQFLRSTITSADIYQAAISGIFSSFFFTLLLMLMFSAGVILYGSLYRSAETAFLLSYPVRVERVFLHQFHDALLFTSWGFVLLGSPMVVAFGVVSEAPWYYYAMLPLFIGSFVYIPVALGAIACQLIVDKLPAGRQPILLGAGLLTIMFGGWLVWSILGRTQDDILTAAWLREMLGRLQLTQVRLLPSWWLTAGLFDAADGMGNESYKFLAVLIANALLLRQIAIAIAGASLRRAYCNLNSRGMPRRAVHVTRIDRCLALTLLWLPRPIRLLLVKDLRTFRRDPSQWLQFVIFFMLLLLYFSNIRSFTYNMNYIGWVHMVSFLNVTVVGLLMSTFTTRFVYPMISLEGRRFWLLGLLPIPRDTILWSKFTFAIIGTSLPCAVLILVSDVMLGVGGAILLTHQLVCALLCVGLAGIAVGLGARLPNMREQSPSRIAAGFGGTLNLVVSSFYILMIVLLAAVPAHFYHAGVPTGFFSLFGDPNRAAEWLQFAYIAGLVLSVLMAVIAVAVPMRLGLRAFRRLDF